MKVKIGDLTVRQMKAICEKYDSCIDCPFYREIRGMSCIAYYAMQNTEKEIDLPDEEKNNEN